MEINKCNSSELHLFLWRKTWQLAVILFSCKNKRLAYVLICAMFLYIYIRCSYDILYRVDSYSVNDFARYYLDN